MKIKRLTVRLPAHMKGIAAQEARQIAEAVGREVAAGKTPQTATHVPSHGHRGAVLGAQVRAALKGGRHGG